MWRRWPWGSPSSPPTGAAPPPSSPLPPPRATDGHGGGVAGRRRRIGCAVRFLRTVLNRPPIFHHPPHPETLFGSTRDLEHPRSRQFPSLMAYGLEPPLTICPNPDSSTHLIPREGDEGLGGGSQLPFISAGMKNRALSLPRRSNNHHHHHSQKSLSDYRPPPASEASSFLCRRYNKEGNHPVGIFFAHNFRHCFSPS